MSDDLGFVVSEEADFAVVSKFDERTAVFEGDEEAVYKWLTVEDRDTTLWVIWDLSVVAYETVEEFLARVGDRYKPQLTKDDVRKIVDARLTEVLEDFRREADSRSIGLAAYEVGELARSAFSACSELTRAVADKLSREEEEK